MKNLSIYLISLGLLLSFSTTAQNIFPSSGNVGLNTNSPKEMLHLKNGSMLLEWSDRNPNERILLLHRTGTSEGSYGYKFSWRNDDMSLRKSAIIFDRSGDTYFHGNVGVGTNSPSSKLDVTGEVRVGTPGSGKALLTFNSERSWAFKQYGSGASTALELASIGGGGNKNFLINTQGYVGIGTSNPTSKLDVIGAAKVGQPGEGNTLLTFNTERSWAFKQIKTGASTALELASIGGSGNKNFIINTTGGIGMGTANIPTGYKLAVDGKIIGEEVKIQLSQNWADYVFQDDYDLKSLEEVEQTIEERGHLHNIASAAEIKAAGGIELGDITVNQQEKIEELFLHLIELNKEVKALQQEIKGLKSSK